ncbi:MAG TPA: type II toxin-antitoxin system Phd/YefM family antitoxin [Thermoanaerobacterales bacterium]|nr:type II toxin-antitoxin system Phd/YefM family antitoxin [Thermoanaerobacterales bacterium]
MEMIRPSSDLRNHYNDFSKICRETRRPVIITVNGRGDTAVLGYQQYQQMVSELELLRTLAEAEEDVVSARTSSAKDTFSSLQQSLLTRKNK